MVMSEEKMQRPSDLEIRNIKESFFMFKDWCKENSCIDHFGNQPRLFLGKRARCFTAIDLDRLDELYYVPEKITDFDPQPPSDNEIDGMVLIFIAFQNLCIKKYRSNHFGDEIHLFLGTRTPWYGADHLIKLEALYLTKKYMIKNQSPKKIKFDPSAEIL